GGVMAIRRWLFYPPRENLRLFTTVYQALAEQGVADPGKHLMVIAPVPDYRHPELKVWGLLIFSATPFTDAQIARAEAGVRKRNFSFLFRPDQPTDTPFSEFARTADRAGF